MALFVHTVTKLRVP